MNTRSTAFRKLVVDAVVHLRQEYRRLYNLRTAKAINNGYCGEFADDLLRAFSPRGRLCSTPLEFDHSDFPAHLWVKFGDFYVDSEAPNGVKDWRYLPFFKRVAEKKDRSDLHLFSLPISKLPSCLEPRSVTGKR